MANKVVRVDKLCPFYSQECSLPAGAECPIHPRATDMAEWKKQAEACAGCTNSGHHLTTEEYRARERQLVPQDDPDYEAKQREKRRNYRKKQAAA